MFCIQIISLLYLNNGVNVGGSMRKKFLSWMLIFILLLASVFAFIYFYINNTIQNTPYIALVRCNQNLDTVKTETKHVYSYISSNKENTFLNYGFLPLKNAPLESALTEAQVAHYSELTSEQASARLVAELISDVSLAYKRILDVGTGKGGTLNLISKYYKPAKLYGIDISPNLVQFNQDNYRDLIFNFKVGDAEALPFSNASMDVVTNVESSHGYPNPNIFYAEVARVLKPGGYFLYADFFLTQQTKQVKKLISQLGFEMISERDVTQNVLESRRQYVNSEIDNLIPNKKIVAFEMAINRLYRCAPDTISAQDFVGVEHSTLYKGLEKGQYAYKLYRFRKRAS